MEDSELFGEYMDNDIKISIDEFEKENLGPLFDFCSRYLKYDREEEPRKRNFVRWYSSNDYDGKPYDRVYLRVERECGVLAMLDSKGEIHMGTFGDELGIQYILTRRTYSNMNITDQVVVYE